MRKDSVVRARIDANLKSSASKVLKACGLELSDAIRLYLQQVVVHGGIPFRVDSGRDVHRLSGEEWWALKRAAQARDNAPGHGVRADLSGERRLLIRPMLLVGAKVKWSKAALSD